MPIKLIPLALLFVLTSACTSKKTQCTQEPREKWIDQENFKTSLIEKGYKINVLKVTEGNCYEIYGWDQEERKVEIYFNPVDGSVVKEEIK